MGLIRFRGLLKWRTMREGVHDGTATSSDVCVRVSSGGVETVRNSTESVSAIARDLGISVSTLRLWIAASRPPPEVPLTDDEHTELRRLRKENRELRMERDILRKATAFFAKHSE
jgi:transposase